MNNTLGDNENIYSEDNPNKLNQFGSSNYCELYLPKIKAYKYRRK